VQITCADLEAGAGAYALLLGAPAWRSPGSARFELGTGIVEVVSGPPRAPRLLVASDGAPPSADWGGLGVDFVGGSAGRPRLPSGEVLAIDHVVVATEDPERAVATWRDRVGFRLALDRAFPDRGLRMIFLRSGGITLEVTAPLSAARSGAPDTIFGLAYRVSDLEGCRARLAANGVDVSEVRKGRKPGTEVVTVRSGTENVPTLLIRDPSRDERDGRSPAAR
jgi:catechol 2,3-dioxygenase-like lactoylglutathione lyase family enzyme